MKARVMILMVLVAAVAFTIAPAQITNVYMTRLFADAYQDEDYLQVDDASKMDELKLVKIVSRDGKFSEVHGIQHIYDGRAIHLTKTLKYDYLSGARIYQVTTNQGK